ncbi:MAG: CBS domain-containing protein [Candidatus Kariarchaeaceae archaeon]|jgi:CBS domain-containing protein
MVPRDHLITLNEDATVLGAMEVLVTNRIGSIVVFNEDLPTGIVTSKDLMQNIIIKKAEGLQTPLSEVMSMKLLSINEKQKIEYAIAKMEEYKVHHIIVKDKDGQITGLISSFDIVREKTLDFVT